MSWLHTVLTTLALQHIAIGLGLLIVLTLAFKLFKVSPEMKSWLWLNALFAAILMPFLLISPGDEQEAIQIVSQVKIQNIVTDTRITSEESEPLTLPTEVSSKVQVADHWHVPSAWISDYAHLLTFACVIWLLGSLWRLGVLLKQHRYTEHVMRTAEPWHHQISHPDLDNVAIYLSEHIESPVVTGVKAPRILLPAHFVTTLSSELLVPILLHEKAHMVRDDILIGLIQNIIGTLFWWSPIVRIINQRVHINRELACDIRAANAIGGNKQYAQSLISCARIMLNKHQDVLAMSLFSRKKELTERVETVLTNSGKPLPARRILASLCTILTVVTMGVAQSHAPKLDLQEVSDDARPFTVMSRARGEALISAVVEQDTDLINLMVQAGMNINTPAIGDGTALMIAVARNDARMVEYLVDIGANVNQSSAGDGNPLIIAAARNHMGIAQYLINQGAQVDSIVPGDETPLINASRNGHVDMVEFLLAQGADPNLAVQTGWGDRFEVRTPMNMARNSAVRELLIQAGAEAIN